MVYFIYKNAIYITIKIILVNYELRFSRYNLSNLVVIFLALFEWIWFTRSPWHPAMYLYSLVMYCERLSSRKTSCGLPSSIILISTKDIFDSFFWILKNHVFSSSNSNLIGCNIAISHDFQSTSFIIRLNRNALRSKFTHFLPSFSKCCLVLIDYRHSSLILIGGSLPRLGIIVQ